MELENKVVETEVVEEVVETANLPEEKIVTVAKGVLGEGFDPEDLNARLTAEGEIMHLGNIDVDMMENESAEKLMARVKGETPVEVESEEVKSDDTENTEEPGAEGVEAAPKENKKGSGKKNK